MATCRGPRLAGGSEPSRAASGSMTPVLRPTTVGAARFFDRRLLLLLLLLLLVLLPLLPLLPLLLLLLLLLLP